jgi:Ca2+-binding EF-hand superfamily protein
MLHAANTNTTRDMTGLFNEADTNKDGDLSWEEMQAFGAKMGLSNAQTSALFRLAEDVKDPGHVHLADLVRVKVTNPDLIRKDTIGLINEADTNKDGDLSWEEMQAFGAKMGLTNAQTSALFGLAEDPKNPGHVHLADLVWVVATNPNVIKQDLPGLMNEADTNKDGDLSWEEMQALGAKMGLSNAQTSALFGLAEDPKNPGHVHLGDIMRVLVTNPMINKLLAALHSLPPSQN